jgi:hypothetical protein
MELVLETFQYLCYVNEVTKSLIEYKDKVLSEYFSPRISFDNNIIYGVIMDSVDAYIRRDKYAYEKYRGRIIDQNIGEYDFLKNTPAFQSVMKASASCITNDNLFNTVVETMGCEALGASSLFCKVSFEKGEDRLESMLEIR